MKSLIHVILLIAMAAGSAWAGPDILFGSQPGFQDGFGDGVVDELVVLHVDRGGPTGVEGGEVGDESGEIRPRD